jgi:hypothetical protein
MHAHTHTHRNALQRNATATGTTTTTIKIPILFKGNYTSKISMDTLLRVMYNIHVVINSKTSLRQLDFSLRNKVPGTPDGRTGKQTNPHYFMVLALFTDTTNTFSYIT